MKKLTYFDIKPLPEYESIRKHSRDRIIQIKKSRRIALGNWITLVFENRETVLFQIQEMIRTEHLYEETKIQDEIETYNALIPRKGELSATLMIEITEQIKIKEVLEQLQGIDSGNAVRLQIGSHLINGLFEAGHSKEDKLSAVHFVRFPLTEKQQMDFKTLSIETALISDHPDYHARTLIPHNVRNSLIQDLLNNNS